MSESLLEKYEDLVMAIAKAYLDNMAWELGLKYRDETYIIRPHLSDRQHDELKARFKINPNEYAKVYAEFQKMEPTPHMMSAMEAFTASGGNVDIEPVYDADKSRLDVNVQFSIKEHTLDKIEGLSPMEDVILRANAMLQVDAMLTERKPNEPLPF